MAKETRLRKIMTEDQLCDIARKDAIRRRGGEANKARKKPNAVRAKEREEIAAYLARQPEPFRSE